jgi:hypothetical protein
MYDDKNPVIYHILETIVAIGTHTLVWTETIPNKKDIHAFY